MHDDPTHALDEAAQVAVGLPETIGPYRVVGLLGEGAMGRVYLARETHPAREVAIKVVRGISSGALERFRREVTILGQLEHPGIVRLYAAGEETVGGLPSPWFALEYVRGPDLRGYLEREQPDLRARIELLVKLAQAVDYAHRRGIIHRDLKPSNILVDASGQPKILDFGIARLQDEAEAGMTRAGQVMGSLPYMAPEQLEGRSDEADARSDVYALGSIGYEILAGRLPHPGLSTSSLIEALMIVRREEPTPLGRVNRAARGDLSLVIMKALASEPSQRYETAAAFADDLEAVLASRPIKARAPTWTYRSGRFIRRNRALSVAVAVIFLSLVAATIVSALSAQRAQQALVESRARANELAAVNAFVENMLTEADPDQGGSPDMPLREVLERAETTLGGPTASLRVDGQVALLLARTWSGLGESARAQKLLDDAQLWLGGAFGERSKEALMVRLARSEDFYRVGKPDLALEQAQTLERQLQGIDADWARELAIKAGIMRAQAMEATGDVDGAIALDRRILADPDLARIDVDASLTDSVRYNLAYTLNNSSKFPEAEGLLRQVLADETRRLGPDHPQTLYTKKALGQNLHRQGRLQEAVVLYAEVYAKRARRYGPDHPLTLGAAAQLAAAYNTLGRAAEAEPLLREALAGFKQRGEGDGKEALVVRVMLTSALEKLGRYDDAIALADETIALEHGTPNRDTVAVRNVKAQALLESGRVREAREVWRETLALAPEAMGTDHPNYPAIVANAARADLALGDLQAARAKLEPSFATLKAQRPNHPSTLAAARLLVETYTRLGMRAQTAELDRAYPEQPAGAAASAR